jgi:hypothetical protein
MSLDRHLVWPQCPRIQAAGYSDIFCSGILGIETRSPEAPGYYVLLLGSPLLRTEVIEAACSIILGKENSRWKTKADTEDGDYKSNVQASEEGCLCERLSVIVSVDLG